MIPPFHGARIFPWTTEGISSPVFCEFLPVLSQTVLILPFAQEQENDFFSFVTEVFCEAPLSFSLQERDHSLPFPKRPLGLSLLFRRGLYLFSYVFGIASLLTETPLHFPSLIPVIVTSFPFALLQCDGRHAQRFVSVQLREPLMELKPYSPDYFSPAMAD